MEHCALKASWGHIMSSATEKAHALVLALKSPDADVRVRGLLHALRTIADGATVSHTGDHFAKGLTCAACDSESMIYAVQEVFRLLDKKEPL